MKCVRELSCHNKHFIVVVISFSSPMRVHDFPRKQKGLSNFFITRQKLIDILTSLAFEAPFFQRENALIGRLWKANAPYLHSWLLWKGCCWKRCFGNEVIEGLRLRLTTKIYFVTFEAETFFLLSASIQFTFFLLRELSQLVKLFFLLDDEVEKSRTRTKRKVEKTMSIVLDLNGASFFPFFATSLIQF